MQIRPIVLPEFPIGTQYQEFVNGKPDEQVSIKSTDEFMGEQWISLTNGRRYRPHEFRESLSTGREVAGNIVSHKRLPGGSASIAIPQTPAQQPDKSHSGTAGGLAVIIGSGFSPPQEMLQRLSSDGHFKDCSSVCTIKDPLGWTSHEEYEKKALAAAVSHAKRRGFDPKECQVIRQHGEFPRFGGKFFLVRYVPKTGNSSKNGGYQGLRAGQERYDNELKMKLVWCPPGSFSMGSPPSEEGRLGHEEEQVQVTLTRGFWIGKHEVTQAEWERVMGTAPWTRDNSVKVGPRYPATFISWEDATEFARMLTGQEREEGRLPTGWEYKLPTEAQWEYACRAGTQTAFSCGNDVAALIEYAWVAKFLEPHAYEVGLKKPNAWGMHDMHGNVCEWCRDIGLGSLPGGKDPLFSGDWTSLRRFRGGCWLLQPVDCRAARRPFEALHCRSNHHGFRVVCSSES